MPNNAVQFAVIREDPQLEMEVLRRRPSRRALLIASGGCTALTLQAVFPDLEIDLLDPNPAQLDLVRSKMDALTSLPHEERRIRFNVEDDDATGLSEQGMSVEVPGRVPYHRMRCLACAGAFFATTTEVNLYDRNR